MTFKISERFTFAYILALLGGYIAAYSYVVRGGIFASAQTGNLIQLSLKLAQGNFDSWYLHILPMILFGVGVILCEILKDRWSDTHKIHWRYLALSIEALVLIGVALIEVGELNVYANMLLGLAAGVQTQFLRTVHGTVLMTTMLTGNARTIAEQSYYAVKEKDMTKFVKIIQQLGVIITFILGVICGGYLSVRQGQIAIIYGIAFVVVAQIILFLNNDNI